MLCLLAEIVPSDFVLARPGWWDTSGGSVEYVGIGCVAVDPRGNRCLPAPVRKVVLYLGGCGSDISGLLKTFAVPVTFVA